MLTLLVTQPTTSICLTPLSMQIQNPFWLTGIACHLKVTRATPAPLSPTRPHNTTTQHVEYSLIPVTTIDLLQHPTGIC